MKDLMNLNLIRKMIFLVRGQKVMLDYDLANLYGIKTKQLKRAVKRNIDRFPDDFMFHLKSSEYQSLRCQFGTLNRGAHSKYLPYAFTEQGVAMLSSVIRSKRAIQVNIQIMRVFVKLKNLISKHKELSNRLTQLEYRMDKKDKEALLIFEAIQQLIDGPQKKKKKKIGFVK